MISHRFQTEILHVHLNSEILSEIKTHIRAKRYGGCSILDVIERHKAEYASKAYRAWREANFRHQDGEVKANVQSARKTNPPTHTP